MWIYICLDEQCIFLDHNIDTALSLRCILKFEERRHYCIKIKMYNLIKILKTAHADIEIQYTLLGEFNYIKTTDLLGQLLGNSEVGGSVEL